MQNIAFSADGNAVVLGRGSETVDGAVSVGSAGAERQIKHVADAVESSDLINLGQLRAVTAAPTQQAAAIAGEFGRIDAVSAMTAAMSALQPNPRNTGPFSVSFGLGLFEDETAQAVGLTLRTGTGAYIRAAVAGSNRTSPMTSISFNLAW